MQRTGIAELPLHYGKAPRYLTVRMRKLAREMITIIIDQYGSDELLRRVSDPFWFQALGCILGYDWHSSGVTTVLTGVLKQAMDPDDHDIAVCGGKGKVSKRAPSEIENVGERFGFSTSSIEALCYASRMSAKVDNAAIQAGYQLYHHAFFVSESMKWAVVQQGMCTEDRTARRYHWLSENTKSFVIEPHSAIVGDVKREKALDMTAKESEACRRTSVDMANEPMSRLRRLIISTRPKHQRSLSEWLAGPVQTQRRESPPQLLSMPWNISWKTLEKVYEFRPSNYEELLGFRGVGPATVRGLALVAEMIYGDKPSWRDPIKYSFAYGGKDGVPYPVDRRAMDESIQILRQAVQEAKTGSAERMGALRRLGRLVPEDMAHQDVEQTFRHKYAST